MVSDSVARKALASIKRVADYDYFFSQLSSVEWVEPLARLNMFKQPPSAERKGEYLQFPPWPESQYLARVAASGPQTVMRVIEQIPPTDNASVQADLIDAALSMPSNVSVRLRKQATVWAQHPYLWLPDRLSDLIVHWAKGGKVKAALDLMRELLSLKPDPRTEQLAEINLPPTPRSRFDNWEYQHVLEAKLSVLVEFAQIEYVRALSDLLQAAIELSQRNPTENGLEDYTFVSRPAIENHEQNGGGGVLGALISAVRDAAVQLVASHPEQIPAVIQLFRERRWHIFTRLAMYLLYTVNSASLELAKDLLLDNGVIDNQSLRHEYAHLSSRWFHVLAESEQREILGYMEHEVSREALIERYKEWRGEDLSDQDADNILASRLLTRLAPIKQALPQDWQQRYQELAVRFGEPQHPDFVVTHSGPVWGPTSPVVADNLGALSIADLVSYLREWQPNDTTSLMPPSPEGLGRELSRVVVANPQPYADAAVQFRGLDPTYVRSLLSGFREAVKEQKVIEWEEVIALSDWAVTQPVIEEPAEHYLDRDNGWGWTRREIASLFSVGFEERPGAIPFNLREGVWKVVAVLAEDAEPTPEFEARYGGTNMDPLTLSLNSTRGEALHAVVRYALWVRRQLEAGGSTDVTLQAMPEVRRTLEAHLDPSNDASPAMRAVYGMWLPYLVHLDRAWVEANFDRLFPNDPSQSALYDAAWGTYLLFARPYADLVTLLEPCYRHAIDTLSPDRVAHDYERRIQDHLSEHLMLLYGWGRIPLQDEAALIPTFFHQAPQSLRGSALSFIGRSVSRGPAPAADIMSRFMALWEYRLAEAREAMNIEYFVEELSAFAWWFASGRFDPLWSLDQFAQALRLLPGLDTVADVYEQLQRLARDHPREVLTCLSLLIDKDNRSWGLHLAAEHIRPILEQELQSNDGELREAAETLVHKLGALGETSYRTLLPRKAG